METATLKQQRYTKYKPSNEEWLGDIPEHWEISKFKRIFFEKKKTTNIDLNCGSISYGKVVYKNDESVPVATKKSYQVVSKGDFLVNPLNLNYDLVSLRIGLSEIDVVVSSGYIVLNTNLPVSKAYYKWLLHIFDIAFMKTLGSGVRQTLSYTHIANCELVIPPLEEQTIIAQFLDDKTAKIDQGIVIKQKQIELLKERKQILIHKAVTRGLDDTVKFKDSGMEWIGEIPEHWEALSNKYIFKLNKSLVGKKSSEYDLLSLTLNGVIKRNMVNPQGKFPAEFDTYQEVQKRDFIFCLFDVEETPRTVGLSDFDGMITGAYTVMKVNEHFDNSFLYYFYLNLDNEKRMKPLYTGLRNTISKDNFFSFKTFVPPKNEQTEIASFIETINIKITTAISLKEQEIEKLREYKISLVNSVVTGKLKVKAS